jgi:hypothetical protein
VVLVGLLVLGLVAPARAVMPPPVRLAQFFERVPWTDLIELEPRPAWQIAFEWSPHGPHR